MTVAVPINKSTGLSSSSSFYIQTITSVLKTHIHCAPQTHKYEYITSEHPHSAAMMATTTAAPVITINRNKKSFKTIKLKTHTHSFHTRRDSTLYYTIPSEIIFFARSTKIDAPQLTSLFRARFIFIRHFKFVASGHAKIVLLPLVVGRYCARIACKHFDIIRTLE